MVYNEDTTLVICVSGAIGPVGPTSNFGRLFIILIENTSVLTKVEYRPIKMPLTPYFVLVTTRGQRSILCLTINPTRGQYHANGTTLRMYCVVRPMAPENNVPCTYHSLHILGILVEDS